ncbi:MAG TPA: hypothetical protein VMV73_03240 [Candidatus Dormibacteraeota bacterium]|nr:hypothetical protein [Candidatus Dormibacteraeota bacterium]
MRIANRLFVSLLAATVVLLLSRHVVARAATPHPLQMPKPPAVALRTDFVVEVNRLGQVVEVTKKHGCKNLQFNAITLGNVLQAWIRHPDGTARVGLYHVTYYYNPRTEATLRTVTLVRAGGNWGDSPGAANEIIDEAKRQAAEHAHPKLPSLTKILKPTPKPTRHPRL